MTIFVKSKVQTNFTSCYQQKRKNTYYEEKMEEGTMSNHAVYTPWTTVTYYITNCDN